LKAGRRDARKAAYRGDVRASTRTHVKKARTLISSGKVAQAETALQGALKALDQAAAKGVIHKNSAARKKSRLMRAMNKAKSSS
jgi:small subunit ribosomal protein S20